MEKEGLTSWDCTQGTGQDRLPKWLGLRAQLSGAQPGFGPASPQLCAQPGGAPGTPAPVSRPCPARLPRPRPLCHPAGTLDSRAQHPPPPAAPPHPPAPRRPLGASSGGEGNRSSPAAPRLRRRQRGACLAATGLRVPPNLLAGAAAALTCPPAPGSPATSS